MLALGEPLRGAIDVRAIGKDLHGEGEAGSVARDEQIVDVQRQMSHLDRFAPLSGKPPDLCRAGARGKEPDALLIG